MHGALENHLTVKVPQRVAKRHLAAGIRTAKPPHAQTLPRFGVASQHTANHPFFVVAGLQHHCGRAVPEQHGDIAIAPVHVAADELHANDNGIAHHTSADHGRGRGQPIAETGARRVQVDRRGTFGAKCDLHTRRAVGHQFVIAHAAVNDEIHLGGIETGARQSPRRSDGGQIDGAHVRNSALLHAGARGDPLVRSFQEGGQIFVAQDRRGHASTPAGNGCVSHGGTVRGDRAKYRQREGR